MNSFMLWHRDPQARLGIASDRRVLRAAEVPPLQDAQQLLDSLRELLAQEQSRIDAACERARTEGLSQGLALAEEQSCAQVADAVAQLSRAHEGERLRLQGEVAGLALEVFQKLLGQVPAEERLARLATQAARELLPARTWRVQAHPSQLPNLRDALRAADPENKAGLAQAEIVADPDLGETDCRLITEFGSADAGLATQIERLARAWGLKP
jgi:flagellar biosynthesis/type III secretory pathway protein FliH